MKNEKNINTLDYWNDRFGSGDWANKGGYSQTQLFAQAQLPFLNIPVDFSGTICDFGCGAGDSFPVYHQAWPKAKLIGIDFSASAINLCRERYGKIADFICGDINAVAKVDVIICSNVLEHLDNDAIVVEDLLKKCKFLYIIVPYKERPLSSEHVRSYDDNSFALFAVKRKVTFLSHGWSTFGWRLYWDIYFKNIARFLLGRNMSYQRRQILFEFTNSIDDKVDNYS